VGTVRRYNLAVTHDTFLKYSKHGHMGMAVTSGRFFGNKGSILQSYISAEKIFGLIFIHLGRISTPIQY
jgi:hypothetical protein